MRALSGKRRAGTVSVTEFSFPPPLGKVTAFPHPPGGLTKGASPQLFGIIFVKAKEGEFQMTVFGLIAIAAALAIGLAALGATWAQGKATAAAMDAIWRQPEAAGDVRGALIVSLALMEAIAIYGLLIGILLLVVFPGQVH
jgi:F-type H+-transporting ATPase subunit c